MIILKNTYFLFFFN